PRVDAPAARDAAVGFSGANRAFAQSGAQRRKRLSRGLTVEGITGGDERRDLVLERAHRVAAGVCAFSDCRTAAMRAFEAGSGGPMASRYISSSNPIDAIALLIGPGFDSMKLTCMNGSSLRCSWR